LIDRGIEWPGNPAAYIAQLARFDHRDRGITQRNTYKAATVGRARGRKPGGFSQLSARPTVAALYGGNPGPL